MSKFKKSFLKRRFGSKSNFEPETEDVSGYSKYPSLVALCYCFTKAFVDYDADFPKYARAFYAASGADDLNHDALDLEIEKKCEEERTSLNTQKESHMQTLELILADVLSDQNMAEKRLSAVCEYIDKLTDEIEQLENRMKEINEKGAHAHA